MTSVTTLRSLIQWRSLAGTLGLADTRLSSDLSVSSLKRQENGNGGYSRHHYDAPRNGAGAAGTSKHVGGESLIDSPSRI